MSTYESAYKSLLQGVSQQLPSSRNPGQNTAQLNMVSDPVTGVRRRPGVQLRTVFEMPEATSTSVAAWFTDIAGSRVHIVVDTNSGVLRVFNEAWELEAELDSGGYLEALSTRSIRVAGVGNEFFLCNTEIAPALVSDTGTANPANSGFFYVAAGAFSKTFQVSLAYNGTSVSASYTTPDGSGAGDAAQATPEYIAQQLYDQLRGQSFSDIVISGLGTGGDVLEAGVQINNGSSAFPNWQPLTLPATVTASKVAAGRLRIAYRTDIDIREPITAAFNLAFRVIVQGTPSELYNITSNFRMWNFDPNLWHTSDLPLTAFTSLVSLPTEVPFYADSDGPYVFLTQAGGVSVETSSGSAYVIASKGGVVPSAGNLPARLPPAADGFVCRVGTGKSPAYYKYRHNTTEWVETGAYGSPKSISGVPVSLFWDGAAWALNSSDFDGRTAGDTESNPAHEWMQYGLTGMGTYQGRLVLLSGPMVALSASNRPRRFFRSTVTSVVSSDGIEVGASMNSAAAYEWAVPFQKDLLLFSRTYQAVLPSGNSAVTPSTATVLPTSSHEVDTTSSPIGLGMTLMYATPRSGNFYGAMEMLPSNFTDSQYVSQDSTPHLPKYMHGRCRFAVASSVSSIAMLGSTTDPRAVYVHEYHWDGDNKVQQAWSSWSFPYDVASAHFAGDSAVLLFVQNGHCVVGTIEPKTTPKISANARMPFLDLYWAGTITDNVIQVLPGLLEFDPAIAGKLTAVVGLGGLAGEVVGTTASVDGTYLDTVLSHPEGSVFVGLRYRSVLVPTPPVVSDYREQTVFTGKATLQRFTVGLQDSAEFEVRVSDAYSAGGTYSTPTLTFSNPDLQIGSGLNAGYSQIVVPCRTHLRSTDLELSTTGTGELNVTSLEYVARYTPKVKRK